MKYIFCVEILIVLGALIIMVACSEHIKQKCIGCDETENQGKCDSNRVYRYMLRKLKCKPEPTIVKLHATSPEFSIIPAVARVNRCSGYCGNGISTCLPSKKSQAKIPVMLRRHPENSFKCAEFHVEQHDECVCDCAVKQEHCSERQKHEDCSCMCHKKLECIEPKVWNEEKCDCTCRNKSECAMGFIWDPVACRCQMMMMSPSDISENFLY